jgi:hypothetical protein
VRRRELRWSRSPSRWPVGPLTGARLYILAVIEHASRRIEPWISPD